MVVSMQDLIMVPVYVLVGVFIFGVSFYLYSTFADVWVNDVDNSTITMSMYSGTTGLYDYFAKLLVTLVFLLAMSSLVAAVLIPVHPIFLIGAVVSLLLFDFLAIIFSDVIYIFITDEIFASIFNSYPLLLSLVKYLPLVVNLIGVALIIIMYLRR